VDLLICAVAGQRGLVILLDDKNFATAPRDARRCAAGI
jgi:hypothetical protein